jgi:hypothetical protein
MASHRLWKLTLDGLREAVEALRPERIVAVGPRLLEDMAAYSRSPAYFRRRRAEALWSAVGFRLIAMETGREPFQADQTPFRPRCRVAASRETSARRGAQDRGLSAEGMEMQQISEAVLKVLDAGQYDGSKFVLVGQLDRKLYTDTNKVLEAAGGKWNRSAKAHVFDGEAIEVLEPIILTGAYSRTKQDFTRPPIWQRESSISLTSRPECWCSNRVRALAGLPQPLVRPGHSSPAGK